MRDIRDTFGNRHIEGTMGYCWKLVEYVFVEEQIVQKIRTNMLRNNRHAGSVEFLGKMQLEC